MYSSYKKTNVKFALHPFHFLFNHIQTDASTLQVWKAGTGSVPHPFSNPDAYPFRGSRLALKRALTRPRSAPWHDPEARPDAHLKRASTRTGARLDAHLKPIRSPERASTRPWSLPRSDLKGAPTRTWSAPRRAPEASLANSLTWALLNTTLKRAPTLTWSAPRRALERGSTRTWSVPRPIRSPERASTWPWSDLKRAPTGTWSAPRRALERGSTRTWSFLGQFAHLSPTPKWWDKIESWSPFSPWIVIIIRVTLAHWF